MVVQERYFGFLGQSVGRQNAKQLSYIEARSREINPSGEFVDPWGNPYRIVMTPDPFIYSCGRNRIDEQGGGDDITSGKKP